MSYSHAFALPQYQSIKTKGKKPKVKKKIAQKSKKNRRPMQGNYNGFY